MDAAQFDALAVSLSRRRAARLLGGVLAGAGIAWASGPSVGLARRHHHSHRPPVPIPPPVCAPLQGSCLADAMCCDAPQAFCGDNGNGVACCLAADQSGCGDNDYNCCDHDGFTGVCEQGVCRARRLLQDACATSETCVGNAAGDAACGQVAGCGFTTTVCCARASRSCRVDCDCCGDLGCVDGVCQTAASAAAAGSRASRRPPAAGGRRKPSRQRVRHPKR
jgi:hypothetical protein